ncbi:hypothetical protein [Clostridium estertheticum]|uniref:hypothetical protein n=1 Tax=Clostridium estertheticum TaxID=238834 RepID=UPI001C7D71FE|nr:hypothetical protein [Clostridium estertheticum]MBX4266807.1 hypothetical protein [Clostridium estertheticum]WLC88996.1 hypothetical protein KTC95_01805 [Clostridium estertheticum]
MNEEELLYNVIFPESNDPNYINYGYFIGRSKKNVFKLKAIINESQLNPVLICDGDKQNAFFAKVFQSEVDRFLQIIGELDFKQIKINSYHMNEVKAMFEEEIRDNRKKEHRVVHYLLPRKFNNGTKNWKIPDVIEFNPINENKPVLKGVINL